MRTTKKVWYAPNKFEAYGEEEMNVLEKNMVFL